MWLILCILVHGFISHYFTLDTSLVLSTEGLDLASLEESYGTRRKRESMERRSAHLKVRLTLEALKLVCWLVLIKQTGACLELPCEIINEPCMCNTADACGIVNRPIEKPLSVWRCTQRSPYVLGARSQTPSTLAATAFLCVLSTRYGNRRTTRHTSHVAHTNMLCSVVRYCAACQRLPTTFKKVVIAFLDYDSAIHQICITNEKLTSSHNICFHWVTSNSLLLSFPSLKIYHLKQCFTIHRATEDSINLVTRTCA